MEEDKADTISLCRLIFNNEYLVNLELAIKCVDDNLCIPYPEDYVRASEAIDKGESLKIDFKRPILIIKDQKSFLQWQLDITRNVTFLKQWLGVVVLGHIREVDEDGERDWEGFEDDLNQVFGEYNLLLPFVSRRNELLGLVKDKSSCLSVLEKYPVEVLRSDLLHFIHEKKNCFSRTVIDQLVCDIADGRYTCTSFPHKKHVSTGDEIITRVSRKRCCREATLECQNRIAEGQKKLKHNENDISPSHVEKIKECIVARYNVSENDLQKRNTLGSQTGNLNLKRGYLHSLISKQSKVTNRPHEATAKVKSKCFQTQGTLQRIILIIHVHLI
ncbi:uncharacterized protein LOC131875918 [Cryptomeria japonica]|uniref:uncharacterized protein LOC131875918 n=1 Tax=Cryptomeria japonica TaxID=3369 RepID=UPI0027DA73B5|nr:uncharacterized protein LOC131875918 [Cryptomeria japonica]